MVDEMNDHLRARFVTRARHYTFLGFLLHFGVLAPHTHAQQPVKMHQIGYLIYGSPAAVAHRTEALRMGLHDVGYIEGKNIALVIRSADTASRLPEVAAEIVRLKVDVIFATSSTEVEAIRQVTKTIPVVFATHADPVSVGHVTSLARPGGNATGLALIQTEIVTKQLEMMKQALPHLSRVGMLLTATAPSHRPAAQALEAAAPKLGVQLVAVSVRAPEDLDAAFDTMTRERVTGFLAVASPLTRTQRGRLAELGLQHRLSSMFITSENVEAGGLMSYGPDLVDMTRRAAIYIDKILKGARPAELPVEQASKFELVINLRTARALGVTIAPSVLGRANRLVE
jgi:ABC-type uncharacterized transport system substrate-binding protein